MSSAPPKKDGSSSDQLDVTEHVLEDLQRDLAEVDEAISELMLEHPLNEDMSEQERELLDQIGDNEGVLDDLAAELAAADDDLRALSKRNDQYEVLSRICSSLEELEELDALHLFYGKYGADVDHAAQLGRARRSIEDFTREIAAAEDRRLEILERIDDQNLVLDNLDVDLRNAMEREERRLAEWVVEAEPRPLEYRAQIMPWARGEAEDQRFRMTLGASILVALLFATLFPLIDLPIPLREKLIEVPERVAKMIREEQKLPEPPPPVVAEEEPVPEEEPEPVVAEEVVEELTTQPEQPVVAEEPKPDTRETAKKKGILAFRESFANRSLNRPNTQLGSEARFSNAGEQAVGRPERSMVTTSAPGTSGGINLSDLSRDVGGAGQGIDGVEVAQVASVIGDLEGPNRPLSSGPSAGRTDEEIQIVFDRYKAALYRLYNRELRKNPTLRGQIVLNLTIEPDGSVSFCEVQSTNMAAPLLAEQVVGRVRGFDFGAKEDIVAVTIIYPIDFLPAS